MFIQYASDLHLEFPDNKEFMKLNPLQPFGDVLLLAGDIVPFSVMDKHSDFFNYISENFKETYWVPGNHEYYGFDLAKKSGIIHEKIKHNVHLVNNLTVNYGDVSFIFSTLWSKISPINEWSIQKNINDFHAIRYQNARLLTKQFNILHDESLNFISSELSKKAGAKSIVVTHHVPTLMNYPQQYKGDPLTEAFAVELFDLIEKIGPDYWIYGHHHQNTPDFDIGKTQMLTNQLGYVKYGEHLHFKFSNGIKNFNI